jgi:DNA-binding NarL/FixJ family response regulator
VAAGESLLAPSVTRRLIADFTRRLPRHGGPVTAAPPAPPRGEERLAALTARERETLRHLALGMSNAEIAAALVVSEHTVKTHVSNVLSKLGLRDRVHAVICAYETGLVVPEGG